jgi:hypothetical protein
MLSHYIPRPVKELQFDQISATQRKQDMPGKTRYPIVQLADGSIDYRYYARRGLMARNGEIKITLRNLAAGTRLPLQKFTTLVAVIAAGLSRPHPPAALRR